MEEDYEYFSIEDFVWDDDFRKWVLQPDAASEQYWNAWLAAHPNRKEEIEKAADIIKLLAAGEGKLEKAEETALIDDIFTRINQKQAAPPVKRKLPGFLKWVAAASVILISLAFLISRYSFPQKDAVVKNTVKDSVSAVQFANNGQNRKEVQLPDGSSVTLESGAVLTLSPDFDNNTDRAVSLEGEAFFDVAKDSTRPFYVMADKLKVSVLGTSFNVRSQKNSNKMIDVVTGIVKVTYLADDKTQEQVVYRNQRAYVNEAGNLKLGLVDAPIPAAGKNISFDYDEARVETIFANFETAYGIRIEYNDLVGKRKFSGNLTNRSFMEKLTILCKAINCRFIVAEGNIRVIAG